MTGEMHFDVKSFKADTCDLSTAEIGAYLLILLEMHLSEDGWVRVDDLRRLSRVPAAHWNRVHATLRRFLIVKDGRATQKRIQRDKAGLPTRNTSRKTSSAYIEEDSKPLETLLNSETTSSQRPRTQKRARPRTALPENWMPGVEELKIGKEHGFDQDRVIGMARAFKDYHIARGNLMACWLAAWRTWVNNEAKYHPYGYRPNGGYNGKRNGSVVDAFDELQREFERRENSSASEAPLLGLPGRKD